MYKKSKRLFKEMNLLRKFNKEETGALFVEFIILLGFIGVTAVVLVPVAKTQLGEIYENQATNMTFSGHKMNSSIDATPKTNRAPEVDCERKTRPSDECPNR